MRIKNTKDFFLPLLSVFILALFLNCSSSTSRSPSPTIVAQPSDVTVIEPEAAVFSVEASGDEPLSYQWRRNGEEIPGATDTVYSIEPTSIEDDGARFSVVVTNSKGSATSDAATLTIKQPPTIVTQPSDVTVIEPETAVFSVEASGDEPLSYQWIKNGLEFINPATSYIIAYWKLDEKTGSIYYDAFGDHHGNCAGDVDEHCPVPASGRINGGQEFDGNKKGIDVPAKTAFNWRNDDSFSVELWVKAVAGRTCETNDQIMIGRVDELTGLRWTLGCVGGTGEARFQLADDNGTEMIIESNKVITTGAWHHIVAARDGVNDTNTLYVDGTDVVSKSQVYNGSFTSATAPLHLGYMNFDNYFEGVLDEVAIYNNVFSENDIRAHYFLSRGYLETCDTPVRIMPLGDSITVGSASGVDDADKMISYRKDLWDLLVTSRYDVAFVGSQENGWFYDGFDPYHEGHSGATDQEISIDVVHFLKNDPADIVLLHIGTNGRNDSDPEYVEKILDEIDWYEKRYDTSVTVVLARIINRAPEDAMTTEYNDNVIDMAQSRIDDNGDNIIIVDMEFGAGIIYKVEPEGDMWDDGLEAKLHPYKTGYKKMAQVWFDALDEILPDCRYVITGDTLEARRTQAEDDDNTEFSVIVSNPYGSTISQKATLTVTPSVD